MKLSGNEINRNSIKQEIYSLKPEIEIVKNLRFIKPYKFVYKLFAKGRWVNRLLIEVLKTDFNLSEEYCNNAFEDKRITVNLAKIDKYYILQKGDYIEHEIIRKENPIINSKLKIVYEDKDFLVVDKPASWPVHVCGGYQFNTLHRILMDEFKISDIKVLHRLDKHTSGIVVLAKSSNSADFFRKAIDNHEVEKIYYARVKGNFKWDSIQVIRAIKVENRARGIYCDVDDIVENDVLVNKNFKYFDKEEQIFIGIKQNFNENNNIEIKDRVNISELTDSNNLQKNENKNDELLNIDNLNEENIKKDEENFILNETSLVTNNMSINKKIEAKQLKKDKKLKKEKQKSLDGVKSAEEIKNLQSEGKFLEDNTPKYAETFFEKIFYDETSNTSVVKAYPKTGRTHQIRIHLRYLGFPIANDPCYGGIIFNDVEELDGVENKDMMSYEFSEKDFCEKDDVDISVSQLYAYKIWLHAYKYTLLNYKQYSFETDIPEWAQNDYVIKRKFI